MHLRCGEANAYEYVGENEGKKQKILIGVVSRAGEKRICAPLLKKHSNSHD